MDPGGVVRKEYQLYQLATKDGRVLSGLIGEQTPVAITLRNAKGERTLRQSYGSLVLGSGAWTGGLVPATMDISFLAISGCSWVLP